MATRVRFACSHEADECDSAENRHTSALDVLDQECEMLDVPWVGIVRIRLLKVRSEHDFRSEQRGTHCGEIRCSVLWR